MAKKTGKAKQLWLDFKKFISRGSVIDMAIGVVIGGAFSAIITSVVAILTTLCAWMIPGGIEGLITVLPAADFPETLAGVGQFFNTSSLEQVTTAYSQAAGITYEEAATFIANNYNVYGGTYVYANASVIHWGNVLNAIISFIIIALTLFIILKVYSSLKASKAKLDAKLLEEYYKKHPEERPVEEAPAPVEPTEKDYLRDIARSLKCRGRAGRRHF
jgi:large-conductance mechanosensitive channel